jgi:hypothetical protein
MRPPGRTRSQASGLEEMTAANRVARLDYSFAITAIEEFAAELVH